MDTPREIKKHIQTLETGRIEPDPWSHLEIKHEYSSDEVMVPYRPPTYHEYISRLEFGNSFRIDDTVYRMAKADALKSMREQSSMQIIHHIYGFMKEDLILLQRAIEYGDKEEARKRARKIYDQIFNLHD